MFGSFAVYIAALELNIQDRIMLEFVLLEKSHLGNDKVAKKKNYAVSRRVVSRIGGKGSLASAV